MDEKTPRSIAARAGAWSARNRKKAVLGWLAFVLVALVVGGAVGQRQLTDEEQGTGESARAERILTEAFPEGPNEQVLVQGGGRARAAALRDVQRTLRRAEGITNIERPQFSSDGRSAVVGFEIVTADDDERAQEVVAPIEAAIERVDARHPGVRVEQFGGASAGRALDQAFEDDFAKAEVLSIPITLVILLPAFGAVVAAALPVLLALSSVAAGSRSAPAGRARGTWCSTASWATRSSRRPARPRCWSRWQCRRSG
jgi:uncharacterized membrane protein YdfJ with MMPL/SSD domain